MCDKELTDAQYAQQDFVDDEIMNLLCRLGNKQEGEIEWDMELISIVREAVQEVICDRLKLMTEMEFYPYMELENTIPAEQLQAESDLIHSWLKTTTEYYDDYTWDGETLILFAEDDIEIERYSRETLLTLIPELAQQPSKSQEEIDAQNAKDLGF